MSHLVPVLTDAPRLFANPDYLVHSATRDTDSFQQLDEGTLASLPGVLRSLVGSVAAAGESVPLFYSMGVSYQTND